MTRRLSTLLLCVALPAGVSEAQPVPGYDSRQFRIERIGEDHVRLIGAVEIERDDWKFFAEEVELFTDTGELIAIGNVVYSSPDSRVAADRVEFNTKTGTGTFHVAAGTVTLLERVDRSLFGTQEPDAYFYGETIEKLGPKKYRITRGGFTTCVQPTPRWELTSNSVVVNMDEYAIMRNTVLHVKGVPLFYLPLMYYPIQEDDRATGFLIPTYGTSTFRGQTFSNAFFWAITRSQDATILYDRFANAGQGLGGEYRYVGRGGSGGVARAYVLNERPIPEPGVAVADGKDPKLLPGRRSLQINGNVSQTLGSSWRARGRVDFFSDVTVQQIFHTSILEASRRSRRFVGNVTGSWGTYSLSNTFDWNETFFGETSSALNGSLPRVAFRRAEQPLFDLPVYLSFDSEYVSLLREGRTTDRVTNSALTRIDLSPVIRVPFTRWPFLTVNSSLAWRNTSWSESRDLNTGLQIESGVSRRFFTMQSRITGPVFTKIWDAPNNAYAERFKHVIEPTVTLQRVTAIDNFDQIVQLEGIDSIVGGSTQVGYGVVNRFLARRRQGDVREMLSITLMQSFYTDVRAAQFDRRFRTSFNGTPPTKLTPVSLVVRSSPNEQIDATLRAEYDTRFGAFRTISADGTVGIGGWMQTTAGWSQRRLITGLPGFNDPGRLDHFLSAATTLKTPDNRMGGVYNFHYDLLRDRYLQQRILAYYNAQCCGVAAEYQMFNFRGLGSRAPVPVDHRFSITFTLAGVGTFSNFFGGLAGAGTQ